MFVGCNDDRLENIPGSNVIRGKGPAERYAFAYIIKADGSVSDLAMEIPSRSPVQTPSRSRATTPPYLARA
nr:hypothetical protein [Corynebacterium tuberculostearicum]